MVNIRCSLLPHCQIKLQALNNKRRRNSGVGSFNQTCETEKGQISQLISAKWFGHGEYLEKYEKY